MKTSSPIVKSVVVSGFVLSLTVFVAYKAGAFDNTTSSSNALKNNRTAVDSPEVKEPMIMPSTKSAPVFTPQERDEYIKPVKQPVDPPKVKKTKTKKQKKAPANPQINNNNNNSNQNNNAPTIIHSTKSGKVI